MAQKKIMGIASLPTTHCFGLRPLLLNGIEIGAVGRQELDSMSPFFNHCDDIGSFVERCSVQDDDGSVGHDRKESQPYPTQEDVRVDVAVPKIYGQKRERQDGADGIQSPFRMPIPAPVAAGSQAGIAVRSWRIDSKATLVEIHDRTLLDLLMPSDSRLEAQTIDEISLGMKQSFF